MSSPPAPPPGTRPDLESEASLAGPRIPVRRAGTLTLAAGRLSFRDRSGDVLVDAPVESIAIRRAPWFRTGTAMRVVVGAETYLVSFKKRGGTTAAERQRDSKDVLGAALTIFGSMSESSTARATRRRWEAAIARAHAL